MDTSKKYIEMCDVKEIQDLWVPDYGDFYNDNHGIRKIVGTLPGKEFVSERPLPLPFIWMPRQDQLQDMVMTEYTIFGCDTIEHFMDDFHAFQEEHNPLFDSMEELTLSFVMMQTYQKEWNGSDWVAMSRA